MSDIGIITNQLLGLTTGQPAIGGGERYLLALSDLLQRLGCTVTIYQHAWRGSTLNGTTYQGARVVPLKSDGQVGTFWPKMGQAFAATPHDHHLYFTAEFASSPLPRTGSILISHGIPFDERGLLTDKAQVQVELQRAWCNHDAVVSCDYNTINVIRAFYGIEYAQLVYHIPNFVDLTSFRPPMRRTTAPIRVVFPRRVHHARGSALLDDIVTRVADPTAIIEWVGGDVPIRDPRVTCRTVAFADMPQVYQQAHIAVIPTLACEGTSLACLEAMACGCAVIATHVGGLCELVQDGVNGRLVAPTADAIAEAINELIARPQERIQLGAAAYAAAQRYSLQRWEGAWTTLLREKGWVV